MDYPDWAFLLMKVCGVDAQQTTADSIIPDVMSQGPDPETLDTPSYLLDHPELIPGSYLNSNALRDRLS